MWVAGARLRDEVLSIAAAADRPLVDCAAEAPVGGARRGWERAPIVVVDRDGARAGVEAAMPRRRWVVLVTAGPADPDDWRIAVEIGAEHVVPLPDEAARLVELLGARGDSPGAGRGAAIGVLGGRGGAGASTFAAALALTAARGSGDVLLVDLDPWGGGIDVLLGIEAAPGLRWSETTLEGGRVSSSALRAALPSTAGVTVLSGSRNAAEPPVEAVRSVIESFCSSGGLVICDVGRQRSDTAVAALEAADLLALVVPAEVRACGAAARMDDWARRHCAHRGVVVRGPAPGGLVAADVAESMGLPLLSAMRPEPGLAERLERSGLALGRRSPLADAAQAVLARVAARPARGRVAA
ncbi:AAA family ATPase [Rhodococcus sp. D2-41]|nr:AAA family ATPase [Rhodococcus sp. D2-41]